MKWKLELLDFIKNNADKMSDKALTEALNQKCEKPLHIQSVRKQRQKLGIFKASGRGFCKIDENHVVKHRVKVNKVEENNTEKN
jgi:hypothetical protein